MLDSHPRISCGPETQFLWDMESIVGARWQRMKLFGLEADYWHKKIGEFFSGFQTDYCRMRGKARWADKSPLYTLKLDFINRVFPECQVIHVVRDPLDVTRSYYERWGYRKAWAAPAEWQNHVTRARAMSDVLGPERFLEIRYEDLVQKTEKTLREVCGFLKEVWDPVMLAFDRVRHDVADWHVAFIENRKKESRTEGPVFGHRIGIGVKKLDPLLKAWVRVRAGTYDSRD